MLGFRATGWQQSLRPSRLHASATDHRAPLFKTTVAQNRHAPNSHAQATTL
ncbi:MAG: hypothetical protein ACI9WS_000445 [Paraglaciecola psychrophila]|jgi:hypothetical protein